MTMALRGATGVGRKSEAHSAGPGFRACFSDAGLPTQPSPRGYVLFHGQSARSPVGSSRGAHRRVARGNTQGPPANAVSYRRVGRVARAHALHVDPAAGRQRLSCSLVGDQGWFLQIIARNRARRLREASPRRTGYLAAPVLGTHDPRPSRLRRPHGLHPFQSSEARACSQPWRLAVFQLSSLCSGQALSGGLGRRRCRAGRNRRAVVSRVGGMRCAFPPYGYR
jgi:hypothetical protein